MIKAPLSDEWMSLDTMFFDQMFWVFVSFIYLFASGSFFVSV